jgi:hypothetical protein
MSKVDRRESFRLSSLFTRKQQIVIPAAFSPRESGEGIQCLFDKRRWVPAFAGRTEVLRKPFPIPQRSARQKRKPPWAPT